MLRQQKRCATQRSKRQSAADYGTKNADKRVKSGTIKIATQR